MGFTNIHQTAPFTLLILRETTDKRLLTKMVVLSSKHIQGCFFVFIYIYMFVLMKLTSYINKG